MTTRCKFRCESKTEYKTRLVDGERSLFDYKFTAVYGDSPENQKFWEWTPAGALNVTAAKSNVFVHGREYYIDISDTVEYE